MAIEIRELLIKVKIGEPQQNSNGIDFEMDELKKIILKECKKEIRKQLSKTKER